MTTTKKLSSLAVAVTVAAAAVLVSPTHARANILPENDLALQDGLADNGMTEEQFNAIIDKIVAIWQPLAALHGAELEAIKAWNDPTVNAYAEEHGNKWAIRMFGGLARRPEITPDGFALVVCHELGHHFGGYAFKAGGRWAATEGEADYFATQVCGKRVFGEMAQSNLDMANQNGPARLANACDSVYQTAESRALCYRETEAGLSLANLLGALAGAEKPSTDKRDQTEVDHTSDFHPKAQCRLDTYIQGALCAATFDLNVIPGRPEGETPTANTPETEMVAGKYSCMQAASPIGFRPRCWFKPLITNGFDDGNGGGSDGNNDNGLMAWSNY